MQEKKSLVKDVVFMLCISMAGVVPALLFALFYPSNLPSGSQFSALWIALMFMVIAVMHPIMLGTYDDV